MPTASWDELVHATAATATALATLHRCDITYAHPVTLLNELATLHAKHDKLAAAMGALHHGRELARIEAAATAVPEEPLRPAHHSLRPAQVLLTNGAVAFIDLDKFCRAEPASDIAALTAKLQHTGLDKLTAPASDGPADRELRLVELRETFLQEYRRTAPVSDDRLALWDALELFSLVLSAAKKMDHARMDSCSLRLDRHLLAHGI